MLKGSAYIRQQYNYVTNLHGSDMRSLCWSTLYSRVRQLAGAGITMPVAQVIVRVMVNSCLEGLQALNCKATAVMSGSKQRCQVRRTANSTVQCQLYTLHCVK